MDPKSWLWRRKSSDKSPGETESSGSASSHSERYSDDQEGLRASPSDSSPIDSSPNHAESAEISPNNRGNEIHETVKSLTEKLSAAILDISAKEALVKQHSKVAEEAVSGWEKTESEVAVLKQQLEATTQQNSILEDKISHLDEALKECVKQLRQAKEEQKQKIHDATSEMTQKLELNNSELEDQLIANLKSKLEAVEKENSSLKEKLLAQSEELEIQILERELSTQAAEAASKQHLEGIKKITKLEAECRKLRTLAQKPSSVNDLKTNSWTSALITELAQYNNEKPEEKLLTNSVDIDIMDDFLEMEKLASMAEADHRSSSFSLEDEIMKKKTAELREKVENLDTEKAKMEIALADSRNQLSICESKLIKLQMELDLANELKQDAMEKMADMDAKEKVLQSQLDSTLLDIEKMQDKFTSLERKAEDSSLSSELKTKLEASEATRESVEYKLQLAYTEVEKLHKKIRVLEDRIEEERVLSQEFADSEIRKLQEKVYLLEERLQDERALSTEFEAKIQAVEDEKKVLEYELESANSDVRKLSDKVSLLAEEVDNERTLSTKFEEKCKNLEDELSRKRREAELRVVSFSNGDLTVKQEKELAMAAERLAECQKTIASLGQQLKSLTTVEDIIIESDNFELNGSSPNCRNNNTNILNTSIDPSAGISSSNLSNGKVKGSPSSPTSSNSMLSGFGRFLSRNRSKDRVENE
ncbi:uncharacterized protein A4U43_C02F7320 [Asparagus officinalis]|uniref:Filament-like plant protein n=1 Tax=Asparagus officinalis TaxID=4686 RepID=A0A5P1FKN2_ASPOF|nr:filament-like plant protein 3 [Asparagus officinalis]XP_020253198.1 filament-like plant protein 3 [Asparagus officinalis]XP_020253199.1 filament-like plant protein 3 [Asparagus officinalis]ONK77509.1 uncharacterized protein A4U43_C02F7320 [Asparagus officinalis]